MFDHVTLVDWGYPMLVMQCNAIINHPYGLIWFIPSIYAKFGDGLLFFLTFALYIYQPAITNQQEKDIIDPRIRTCWCFSP